MTLESITLKLAYLLGGLSYNFCSEEHTVTYHLFSATAPIASQWLKEHGPCVQAFSETQRSRRSKLMDPSYRWAPSHTAATKHTDYTLQPRPCSPITQPPPPPTPPTPTSPPSTPQGWSNVQDRAWQQILRGRGWSRWQLCAAKRDSIKPVSFRRAKPQHKKNLCVIVRQWYTPRSRSFIRSFSLKLKLSHLSRL